MKMCFMHNTDGFVEFNSIDYSYNIFHSLGIGNYEKSKPILLPLNAPINSMP